MKALRFGSNLKKKFVTVKDSTYRVKYFYIIGSDIYDVKHLLSCVMVLMKKFTV